MYTFNIERFASMIEVWLHFHQLTMREMSELTAIGQSTLYALKSGQYAPTMAQFTAICNVMSMPPETFFKKAKGK